MNNVNQDVQGVTQTTTHIYQWILDLWAMTPLELKMYIGAMFIVSILMQYVKKSFLTKYNRKEKVQRLWLVSFPIGISLAFLGYYLYGDNISTGYFVLTGLTVSTISMGVHRIVVDYVWPAIVSVVSFAWARVILLVKGTG